MTSHREQGFRLADRNQVRIEALEKKLRRAIDERDAARAETNQAKRMALTLDKALEDAQHAKLVAERASAAARASLEAVLKETRGELERMKARMQLELSRRTIRSRLRAVWARVLQKGIPT